MGPCIVNIFLYLLYNPIHGTIHTLRHTHFNIQNQKNKKKVFVSIKPLYVSVFF
jgi:hypothetical protein